MNETEIFDLYLGRLPPQAGALQNVLRDTDHLLGRFGEAAWLSAGPNTRLDFSMRPEADRVWAVLEGACWVVLHDLREFSPSRGHTQVVRLDREPLGLLLIPFGVAAALQVLGSRRLAMLILSTYAQAESAPEQILAAESPGIAFDWASLQ